MLRRELKVCNIFHETAEISVRAKNSAQKKFLFVVKNSVSVAHCVYKILRK